MQSLKFIFVRSTLYGALALVSVCCIVLMPQLAQCADDPSPHDMHEMHDGMSMPIEHSLNAETQAKLLADKRESEFNHHLAGLLVLAAGLFIIAEGNIR